MADSTDSDRNRQSDHSNSSSGGETRRSPFDEENPFIAFRRYADEQISSLLHSIVGIPTTFSTPSSHGWLAFQNDPSATRYHQRYDREQYGGQREGQEQGRNDDSNYYNKQNNNSSTAERMRSEDFDFPCRHHHHSMHFPSFFFDSLQDSLWPIEPFPFSRSFFHPDSPFSNFSDSTSWPVPYILFSSYSPLHLERQRRLKGRDGHGVLSFVRSSLHLSSEEEEYREPEWRDAFEDLIRLENGKRMLDRDSQAVSKEESGGDWLAGLVERGSLGDEWKPAREEPDRRNGLFRFQRHDSLAQDSANRQGSTEDNGNNRKFKPEEIDELESFTELDLYDEFLKESNRSSGRDDGDEFTMSPLLRLIFAEQERRREELQEQRRRWKRFRDSMSEDREWNSKSRPAQGDNKEAERPISLNEPGDDQSFNAWRSANSNTNSDAEFVASANSPESRTITSTTTSTERKVLPDGSVQTKVVRRTCFADGTEESNETVNVLNNPRQSDEALEQSGSSPEAEKAKKGSGWFWKE